MNQSVTVSVRAVLLAVVGVVALVAAYVLGTGAGNKTAAATSATTGTGPLAASTSTGAGTITMTGRGEVTAVPDQLSFRVSVTRTREDVPTALDDSTGTLERVLAALDRQGVARKDTQSTGLSIEPVYRYDDNEPPEITGYRVRQAISVLVRDLRTGGRAVSSAVEAGGNAVRVSDIGLRVGDRDVLLADARDAAVEAATAKAEQYAAATGQSLGAVLTLKEGSRAARPRDGYAALDTRGYVTADQALKAVPLRAGREDLSVEVSIVWELA